MVIYMVGLVKGFLGVIDFGLFVAVATVSLGQKLTWLTPVLTRRFPQIAHLRPRGQLLSFAVMGGSGQFLSD